MNFKDPDFPEEQFDTRIEYNPEEYASKIFLDGQLFATGEVMKTSGTDLFAPRNRKVLDVPQYSKATLKLRGEDATHPITKLAVCQCMNRLPHYHFELAK